MSISAKLAGSAAILGLIALGPAPAAAQGQGYGVGEWYLSTMGGASVCHVVLTNRLIPGQNVFRAIVRGGPRCTDWRARSVVMWGVSGNKLALVNAEGGAIFDVHEQSPNLYAAGEASLQRIGSAAPGPGYPPPGYAQPGERPGQGYGPGNWILVTQGGASACHVTLTNRAIPEQGAYRAIVRGGERCTDWRVRGIRMWAVRGNKMGLADGNGGAIFDVHEQNPNLYVGGDAQLRRAGY